MVIYTSLVTFLLKFIIYIITLPVVPQMILPSERLSADITRIRSLVGMSPLVDQ